VELTEQHRQLLEKTHGAAMITLRRDGTAHAVRVGVALVDGKVWSSGTQDRLRTRLLRRDPRCTLFFWEQGYGFLTLEGKVTILEGPEAPELSLRLFRTMQAGMSPGPAPGNVIWYGKELTPDEFRAAMVRERRLIYQLEVERAYGPSMR
jgi:PPOX class probable F420-dependent enzyme